MQAVSALFDPTTVDDPHHTDERKLVLPGQVAKRIRALEPFIEQTAHRLWAEATPKAGMEWMSAMATGYR